MEDRYGKGHSGRNPNLEWCICIVGSVAGLVQTTAPAHGHHYAHQLCQSSLSLAHLTQGHAEGVPGMAKRHDRVVPGAEKGVKMGQGCWAISNPPSPS